MTAPLLWATTSVLAIASTVLLVLGWNAPVPDQWGFRGYWILMAPVFATPGLLIARRQPGNPIGWLLLLAAMVTGFTGFAQEYAAYSVFIAELPAAMALAWLSSWIWVLFAAPTLTLVPQLFPTGRPLSERWRPLVWASGLFVVMTFVVFGLRPGPLENATFIENPLAARGAIAELRLMIATPITVGVFGLTLASGVSIVLRFRRSRGVERQQLKWAALSGVALVIAMGVIVATTPVATGTNTFKPAQVFMIFTFATFPVAIGIAMLRYRLYDVDLIINRAIVYGALTAALGVTYAASVVLLQTVLRPLTGGSEIAVAASTLSVVALIQPLRRRIQAIVDRRFYRSRYDAARTLDAFASRLRDEVDLDRVRGDLLDAIGETVRPKHAAIWFRESAR
jgi:hypothetical protein